MYVRERVDDKRCNCNFTIKTKSTMDASSSSSLSLSLYCPALVKTQHVALSSAADVAYFYAPVSINFLR